MDAAGIARVVSSPLSSAGRTGREKSSARDFIERLVGIGARSQRFHFGQLDRLARLDGGLEVVVGLRGWEGLHVDGAQSLEPLRGPSRDPPGTRMGGGESSQRRAALRLTT